MVSNREYCRRRLNTSTDFCTHEFSKKKAKANLKYKILRHRAKIEAGMGSTSRLDHEVCMTGLTSHMEVIELKGKQLSDQISLPQKKISDNNLATKAL